MAITSIGYGSTVNQVEWAKLLPYASSRLPTVAWGVTLSIPPGSNRILRVGAGSLAGYGVRDTISGDTDVVLATLASGTRWDTVVLRRDWSSKTSTLLALTGTATKAPSVDLQNDPGTVADQIIALVKVVGGQATAQEYEDWRHWSDGFTFRYANTTPPPGQYAYGDKILQNPAPGMPLDLAVRRGGGDAPVWDWLLNRPWTNLSLASGYRTKNGLTPQYRIVGDMLQLRGCLERTTGALMNDEYTTVASVPSAVAPKRDTYQPCGTSSVAGAGTTHGIAGGAMCSVKTSGVIQVLCDWSFASWISLDNISIPIGA